MKAVVDSELCTGCELCLQVCEEGFTMGDGVAIGADPVPAGAEESCKQAAEDCPVEAIKIEE